MGTLRIMKIPACATSTRNAVLSLTLAVTVTVSTASYRAVGFVKHAGAVVHADFDLRAFLLKEDLRRIGNFQRQILQIDFFDAELRLWLLAHCDSFLNMNT